MTDTPAATVPRWATELLGPDVKVASVLAGGASRSTLLLEAPGRDGLVVGRHDDGDGPFSGTPFTLAREAATCAALATAGIPLPAVIAVAGDGTAFAAEHLPGHPAADDEALDDYLAVLGRLHASGTRHAPRGHAGFDSAGTEDLAMWERIAAERILRPTPILDVAFATLRDHATAAPPEVVLCHGDAGAGNYLQVGATVTGLVDWEMAHTGDPHDDLASVAVRAVLGRIDVGDFAGRVAAHYEPVAGVRFDTRRHQVAVAAVLTRMVVSCLCTLDHAGPSADRSVHAMGLPVMEVQLVRALAALTGERLPPPPAARPDLAYAAELAEVIADGVARPGSGNGRRLRYIATQMATALRDIGVGDVVAMAPPARASLPDLWIAAHQRLAVLPASRPLAHTPVPGAS